MIKLKCVGKDVRAFKKCGGYKGHHACAEEYPDHMVPVERFGLQRSSIDEKQGMCRDCMSYRKAIWHTQTPRHPITGEQKWIWKKRISEKLGGVQNTPEWKDYLDRTEVMWQEDCLRLKAVSLVPPRPSNIAPFSYPPEHEKRLRRDGRTTESAIIARKANRDDGFDYVMEHPAWPGIRKIGWTYDPPSRLSDFNVCCPYKSFSFPYISVYLENARLAESIVQNALKEYHVTGEWYRVSRELAIKTIEDYVESLNDREEQEMG